MFNKKEKSNSEIVGKTNRIVEGTIIKGNIICSTDFRLDGELIGDFESTGKLVVGSTGNIVGDIVCKNADIEGKFNGSIQVTELLSIKAKASIYGQVNVGKLSVEPGADFTASCSMKANIKNIKIADGKQAQQKTS
ncbi:polymer-forming cytoskeletal protein [Flavobacterium sp.]|uniref:bactofilin family protein n=1 Tax=Flavobacterium sp. TaxID=239 RepID=UPI0026183B73|nr:polymer-forming cytoskeletal protein [Flavobacterium sp.]MDG2433096.1 polymer-forming cytoskeletal protein [Flavobacterium sp.]